MERWLEPGADVPAVDGQLLYAQGEQLPRRAAAGLTRIGAEFVPISTSELCQQGAELCVLGTKGGQERLPQPLPIRHSALGNGRIRDRTRRREFWRRPRLSLHAAGKYVPILLCYLNEMRDHIAHLPFLTGTGLAPGVRGQGGQILRQPLRLRLNECDV